MDFNIIASEVYRIGKEYASAKAKYEMLAESRKTLLAKLASINEGSEATRNRLALANIKYEQHLDGMQQARQKELELKYELDSLTMEFDYYRSMNSLRKKETNIL